jgi:hypothetical protein
MILRVCRELGDYDTKRRFQSRGLTGAGISAGGIAGHGQKTK